MAGKDYIAAKKKLEKLKEPRYNVSRKQYLEKDERLYNRKRKTTDDEPLTLQQDLNVYDRYKTAGEKWASRRGDVGGERLREQDLSKPRSINGPDVGVDEAYLRSQARGKYAKWRRKNQGRRYRNED